jgi:acetyl-CoA carboxylase biotin carboxyl carrier protein
MDIQKIKALIDLAAESGLSELEYEENGCRLRIAQGESRSGPPPGIAASASPPGEDGVPGMTAAPAAPSLSPFLNAPMFGVFCLTPAPGEAPFARVGDTVREGQTLCMLEVMKQFHAVAADRDGKIAAILAENGQEVDAGQALFRFE